MEPSFLKNPDKKILRKIQKIYRNKLKLGKLSAPKRSKEDPKKRTPGSPRKGRRKKHSQGDINISINILDSKLEGNFFNSNSSFIAKGTPTFNVKNNFTKKSNRSSFSKAEGAGNAGKSVVSPKKAYDLPGPQKPKEPPQLFEAQ